MGSFSTSNAGFEVRRRDYSKGKMLSAVVWTFHNDKRPGWDVMADCNLALTATSRQSYLRSQRVQMSIAGSLLRHWYLLRSS